MSFLRVLLVLAASSVLGASAAGAADQDLEDQDLEDQDLEDDDDEDDGEVFVIQDDEFTLGPEIEFDEADLTTTDAGTAGARVTLETLAMAFGRMGVDLVHDKKRIGDDGFPTGGEDTFFFRLHGRAEGTGRFGRSVKVKVAGRFDAETSFDQSADFGVQRYEGQLWDTHADVYASRVDLRFGNQLVAWGYADLLSPNDVVNARDLRRGPVVPMDELRLPVLAARGTAYLGPVSLSGLWVPVAPVNRFELLDGDYAILGPNAPTQAERRLGSILSALQDDPAVAPSLAPILAIGVPPDHGIETGELGASVELRSAGLDAAGYFFWGHERNPRIRVAPELIEVLTETEPGFITPELIGQSIAELSAMGRAAVVVDYPRNLHLGAAIGTRLGDVGVKLDGAYRPRVNTVVVPAEAGPLLAEPRELSQVAATLGLDYSRGEDLNLMLEAGATRALGVPEGREVYGMDGAKLYVVATRIAWKPTGGMLSLRLLGFLDVTSPSYAVKPAVRLSGHDHLSIEIALGLYGGPAGSMGGLLARNDEVILTVQYGL
jgi:hypothetical protein